MGHGCNTLMQGAALKACGGCAWVHAEGCLLALLRGGLVGAEGGNAARQRAQHAARAAEDAEVLHETQRDAAQLALCVPIQAAPRQAQGNG